MSKISFSEIESNSQTETAIVVKPDLAVAVPTISPVKGLLGEWTAQDTRLPRLSLVNKSGELANSFVPGTYVVNREHQINEIDPEDRGRSLCLTVIVASMAKQYQENIPFDDRATTQTRVFNTAKEVSDSGGRISRDSGAGLFSEIAHLEVFLRQPGKLSEDAEALFYYTFGEDRYTRVVWTVSGTAYGAVAVTVASALRGHLSRTGLVGGQWLLSSALIKGTKNSWWQPAIRTGGLVDPEVAQQIEAAL
jgi:hypothetical protein